MTAAKHLRMLVADDRPLVREALAASAAFDAIASDGSREALLADVRAERPDVVVIGSVQGGVVDAVQRVLLASPSSAVLVLASSDQDRSIVDAMRVGAAGFATLTMPIDEFTKRVFAAAARQTILPPEFAEQLVACFKSARPTEIRRARPTLTAREQEILALLTKGLGNAEIANRLGVSPNTVKNHLYSIYRKLGVSSRGQAFATAAELGLAV